MTRKLVSGAALVAVFIAATLLFYLCYRFDNKYTAIDPVAHNGILVLNESQLSKSSVMHLTHGWEIYPGALLSPDEIGSQRRHRIVAAIGEYAGFEFGDSDRSPHGSATYRLTILLPEELCSYMLELPEIYSAYRIYINGSLVRQMGEPEHEKYRPFTGGSVVAFEAAESAEIVISVTDFSHFYSGLVYPPAFGTPDAVMGLLGTRFALRLAQCTLALTVGLYYLITGLFAARRAPISILYGLLCLCFVGYTAYPVTKALWHSGMLWYGVENFCYAAMFLLVMIIQRSLSGTGGKSSAVFFAFGGIVCCAALIMPHIVTGNLAAMGVYSWLMGAYAWVSAAYLTLTSALSLARDRQHSVLVMAGVLVFDAALIMDRLLPLHEPMVLGWFVELAGLIMVVLIGAVTAQEALNASRERLVLEGRIDSVTRLVRLQRNYFPVILSGIERSRALHHDMRHQLRLIRGYLAEGDLDALQRHLEEYGEGLSEQPRSFSRNPVIDTMLRHFFALCTQEKIRFEAHVDTPETIPVNDGDLAALLGNLLENAVEACARMDPGKRRIAASVMHRDGWLYVEVDNSFDGYTLPRGDRLLSRKRGNREGVGLASVRSIATRYRGEAEFSPDAKAGFFRSRVTLRVEE